MADFIDRTGNKYGRWTVLYRTENNKDGKVMWLCKCDCGTIRKVNSGDLKQGKSKSCGCLKVELTSRIHKSKTVSKETRKKISDNHADMSGKNNPMYGVRGKDSPRWNPNLTDEERVINRKYTEYKEWRLSIFERDSYTCNICGQFGGNLNAHHLESYNSNKELRTTLSNGITLCEDCHMDFHHQFGYGDNTKEQFEEFIGE